jgi:hypothetical protein
VAGNMRAYIPNTSRRAAHKINPKAAKALGIDVPPTLAFADELVNQEKTHGLPALRTWGLPVPIFAPFCRARGRQGQALMGPRSSRVLDRRSTRRRKASATGTEGYRAEPKDGGKGRGRISPSWSAPHLSEEAVLMARLVTAAAVAASVENSS